MAPSPHLRTTRRCAVEDLGLDYVRAARDARYYCADHEVLRTFVVRREGAPGIGEPISGIEPRGSVTSLHIRRGRGATRWDAAEDVCWLLAYSPTHASGEMRDAYEYFLHLYGRRDLLPTADDYESLWEISSEALLDELAELGNALLGDARAAPHTEINGTCDTGSMMVLIDLMVIDDQECEEGWVAFAFSEDTSLTRSQVFDLLEAMLPENVDLETVQASALFGRREVQWNEIAYTWTCYPS